MKAENMLPKNMMVLSPEQKQRFHEYLPAKVYKTERNISYLVAISQLCMIFMFWINKRISFENPRSVGYFLLYNLLLLSTLAALVLYRYTFRNKKYMGFVWLRRIYASILCFWVLGVTFLEQVGGRGLSVYCYLLPTTAALLLLTPVESTVIFGGTWVGMLCLLIRLGDVIGRSIFGDVVNSIFVTVLAFFISYRYYRSMAVEFCDRETIAQQYDEIEKSNRLLQEMVHIDQLTGLKNRHFLRERVYPLFENYLKYEGYGTFMMMDIDYFKQYNDLYGHIQGDECLRIIANILRKYGEEKGVIAIRYGGEEFLLLKMSEQELDGEALAEDLLMRIRDADISRDDMAAGQVTVSIGLWNGMATQAGHIEHAIKFADDALYQAKSQGRNRIVKTDNKQVIQ